MLFIFGFFFNFLIGGFTGVFLSDVPSDFTLHASYFVQAHFHYTIMGGEVFALMAAIVYYLPKMTGSTMDTKLLRFQFWAVFITFNGTFISLITVGILGMPRRVISYAAYLQPLNISATVFAYGLGLSMTLFLGILLWEVVIKQRVAASNPWESLGVEWQVPTPVPTFNFDQVPVSWSLPYDYDTGKARGGLRPGSAGIEWSLSMSDVSPTGLTVIDDVEGGGRTLVFTSRLVMAANTTLQLSLLFAFLYLRANNFGGMWHPSAIGTPPQVLALISLAFPVIALVALWAVWNAVSKARDSNAISGLLWLALLAAVLTGAVRILLMYQFNWELDSAGAYADLSTIWYGVHAWRVHPRRPLVAQSRHGSRAGERPAQRVTGPSCSRPVGIHHGRRRLRCTCWSSTSSRAACSGHRCLTGVSSQYRS